jgi:Protein of unknown function (DUF2442)
LIEGLASGKAAQLAEIEISSAGLGLHWPQLDADVYIPVLLRGVFGSHRWMAAHLGAVGGHARSARRRWRVHAPTIARGAGRARNLRSFPPQRNEIRKSLTADR